MTNLWRWGVEQYSYATCTNEGWNTVQCTFVMQLVQMRSNLCKWGVEHSKVMHLVQMRSNLYKWGVEHNSTIFICYATCANEVKLVQMRGGTQYNIHLFCSLCRWPRTCADEGWNSTVMQLVKMRGGTQYNIICVMRAQYDSQLAVQQLINDKKCARVQKCTYKYKTR